MSLIAAFATAAILLADAAPPDQRGCPVAGTYRVAGTNPGGTVYEGTATIEARDGGCYIRWYPPNDSEGTGTYMYGRLKVQYRFTASGEVGEVVYERQPDGSLKGTWGPNGEVAQGTETLTPN